MSVGPSVRGRRSLSVIRSSRCNGAHGSGKPTTSATRAAPASGLKVFDAGQVAETAHGHGLAGTDTCRQWPPWRAAGPSRPPGAYCTGGTLAMPVTVLLEQYWREINRSRPTHPIPVRHVVHRRARNPPRAHRGEHAMPSPFRLQYLEDGLAAAKAKPNDQRRLVDTALRCLEGP